MDRRFRSEIECLFTNKRPMLDSRWLAARMGCPHEIVLQCIRNIIGTNPATAGLFYFMDEPSCGTDEDVARSGLPEAWYRISREGFAMLVSTLYHKEAFVRM